MSISMLAEHKLSQNLWFGVRDNIKCERVPVNLETIDFSWTTTVCSGFVLQATKNERFDVRTHYIAIPLTES